MQEKIANLTDTTLSLTTDGGQPTLERLRQVLGALQSNSCELRHETIVFEGTKAARRSQGIGLEPILVRYGLCLPEQRMNQLSCAHTNARLKLESAVDTMAVQNILDPASACEIRLKLQQMAIEIYKIDMDMNKVQADQSLSGFLCKAGS